MCFTGFGRFECPNLERLECYDNMIKSLDLSKSTKLKVIRINNNPLELIDLGRQMLILQKINYV